MTLLSRKADYALLILSYLHHKPQGTARAIAERYGLSRPFVANILKDLGHAGYVTSTRGVKGGYALLRPAKDVTLAELLEAVEERFQLTVCNSELSAAGHDGCAVEHVCPMKGPIGEIHRRLTAVLRGVTLAELFDSPSAEPRLLPLLTVRTHHLPAETPSA